MSDDGAASSELSRTIVVGSSSGGLEALASLLGAVRHGAGWCIVIAQHLSPTDTSQLVPILARKTALHVLQAADGAALEPDSVLVAPSGTDIVVNTSAVSLVPPDEAHQPWPSVDRLFASAAVAFGERAVGVVLSGAGRDGAEGVKAIRAAGGVVAVQDQASAAFGSMPQAAFATGVADLRLPPDDIPAALEHLLANRPDGSTAEEDHAAAGWVGSWALDDAAVETAIASLHEATGVDYAGYKRSTVRRQIERRMRIANLMPADYVAGLASNATEAAALSQSILVGVTGFFRDEHVWDALVPLLRALVEQIDPLTSMRIWVPGCSTGEEAYTVAMLAAEALGPNQAGLAGRLKVFATDLDESALTATRLGRYAGDTVAAIPAHLRERWLREVGQQWEVVPRLRECLVVAAHNVGFDPPFPRLHLISLRNTLIYFRPQLQDRVMQLCQFALLPDGLLVLGKSEQVSRVDALFAAAAPGQRIYRRREVSERASLAPGRYLPAMPIPTPAAIAARHYHGPALYRRLLKALAAPSLVLDDDDALIEVVGDVSPWCVVSEGRHNGHVTDLLRESYRLVVRMMLSQVRQAGSDGSARRVVVGPDGAVEVTVTWVHDDGIGSVVSFAIPASPPTSPGEPLLIDPAGHELSEALQSAQDALQATIEDLSNSNEELQALNEELQASAEELQATSEEAQASNEELETANEELTSLNHELQARGEDLANANTDLENIQASMTSGLVMVDRELRIVRYSPLAVRVFSLINEDIGRPLPAVPTTVAVPTLISDLQETIATRAPRLIEINEASRDILLQLQPYAGSSGEVLGALVVVIDVSDVAQARREREAALANLETVAESVREIVWQRNDSGALTYLTKRVEDVYGLKREQVLADAGLLAAAIHPADRDRVAAAMASTERRWHLEYRIVRPDGTVRWLAESAIRTEGGAPNAAPSITGSALDVTESHQIRTAAAVRMAVLDALMRTNTVGVLVLDASDRILQVSEPVASIIGYAPAALVGTPLNVLLEHDPAARLLPPSPLRRELDARRILGPDGIYRAVTTELLPVAAVDEDDPDSIPARVAIVHDVTRLREISADLAAREQFDQQTGLLTRTYFHARTDELVTAGGGGLAVLWIDLDGFKEINDRFGHRSGDVVLATIASRLQRAARRHDAIGRLGGDEFAVLVTRAKDLDGIEVLVHRILNAVREPIDVAGTMAYVSASVGIAVSPQDGHTAEELLHNADTAMYAAKNRGRDRHAYFAPDMDNRADERAELRRELAEAVRGNTFELHYQPVFEADTRRLRHVEALLRWRRGDKLVTAEAFINHAIETGQLRAIGRLVLKLLDADMKELRHRLGDRQPQVALNLSGTELEERDTAEWLLTWNPAGGFNRVIAEVTESVLLSPGGRAVETLGVLRRLGATVSVDDFGTGYSNLEALDRLQPEIIKIDRTLLERAAETGPDSRAGKLLAASVQLAHALDAEVVVEGVADDRMWSHVTTLGAEMAQGYFLAPPMSLPTLVDWINAADDAAH